MTVIDWLLDADPSIRWQVLRALTGAPADEVSRDAVVAGPSRVDEPDASCAVVGNPGRLAGKGVRRASDRGVTSCAETLGRRLAPAMARMILAATHQRTANWGEPLFAEAKEWYGLRRLRLRGLGNANIQGLMIAAGQNLKRFLPATGWGRRHAPCGSLVALPREPQRLMAAFS